MGPVEYQPKPPLIMGSGLQQSAPSFLPPAAEPVIAPAVTTANPHFGAVWTPPMGAPLQSTTMSTRVPSTIYGEPAITYAPRVNVSSAMPFANYVQSTLTCGMPVAASPVSAFATHVDPVSTFTPRLQRSNVAPGGPYIEVAS